VRVVEVDADGEQRRQRPAGAAEEVAAHRNERLRHLGDGRRRRPDAGTGGGAHLRRRRRRRRRRGRHLFDDLHRRKILTAVRQRLVNRVLSSSETFVRQSTLYVLLLLQLMNLILFKRNLFLIHFPVLFQVFCVEAIQ